MEFNNGQARVSDKNRDYRALSYAVTSAALGVLIMRIIVYFLPIPSSPYGLSLVSDAIFTLCTQLIFFLVIPFLIFKFYGRRTVKQVFEISSMGKFEPYFLLAIPIGICVWLVTIGVSSGWQNLLALTGYNNFPAQPQKPDNFVFGYFLAEVALTAILPALCEEFVMRGVVLTTLKKSFGTAGCVLLCGVIFGLFHQNIKQVFYTSLFGALSAYLVLRTKSLYPSMIVHFINNFCSVFFDYASDYGWAGVGGLFGGIDYLAENYMWALVLIAVCIVGIGAGLVVLMSYLRDKKVNGKKMEVIKDSGFDVTHGRVVLMGEFSQARVEELEMEKEVYGKDYKPQRIKPKVSDIAFLIGSGVLMLLVTVFTYVWGFFY